MLGKQPDRISAISPPQVAGVAVGTRPAVGRVRATACLLTLLALSASLPAQVPATPPLAHASETASLPGTAIWSSVSIPGPIDALRDAAGILTRVERTRVLLEVARLAYSVPPERDQKVARARNRVIALASSAPKAWDFAVPLPLPAQAWLEVVFQGKVQAADLGAAILRDERAALVYHGLFALDDETLAYLGRTENRALVECVAAARPFSTFGRSIRIHGGRVQVAGGEAAVGQWESLVGAPVTAPDRFIAALLGRDRGWLAYFYDTLAHLDAPRLAFALGAAGGQRASASRFQTFYSSVLRTDLTWVPAEKPFARPSRDLALLFAEIRLAADGGFAQPRSALLWKIAFNGEPVPGDSGTLMTPGPGDAVDAAFLAEQVLAQFPDLRQERFEMVLFGQRLVNGRFRFESAGDERLGRAERHEEVSQVLTALQGLRRCRALVLVLERMGVRDAATYARGVTAADRIDSISLRQPEDRARASVQFQSAIAILDRLVARHSLAPVAAAAAVNALANLSIRPTPLASPSAYNGTVGVWFRDSVVKALNCPLRRGLDPASIDDVVLNALAGPVGRTGGVSDTRVVSWEEQTYTVDLGAAELARLRRSRLALGEGSLDLAVDVSVLATDQSASLPALQQSATRALGLLDHLHPQGAAGTGRLNVNDVRQALGQVADRFPSGPDKGGSALAARRARLARYADALAADVLATLVYATHVGELDPLLGSFDLVSRHDLNYQASRIRWRDTGPWSVPTEVRGGGRPWHLVGSLLAIDVPFAQLVLHRISSEARSQAPTIDRYDAATFSHTVALADPYATTDEGQAAIVTAMQRGLERVNQMARTRDGAAAASLATAAGLSEWRANGLRLALRGEPEAATGWFTLVELMWLGQSTPGDAALDAWGVSIYGLAGQLASRFPRRVPWEDLAGRPVGGLVATQIGDRGLSLALWLQELHLPAALLPALMTRAMQDLLDEAQPSDAYDGTAVARAAAKMTRERFEDYVSTLTAEGPLVPAAGSGRTLSAATK